MTDLSPRVPVYRLMKPLSDCTNIDDVLKTINGDFAVEKRDTFFLLRNGDYRKVRDHQAIVREDDEMDLSVMKDRYGIVQFAESVAFVDDIISQNKATFYTGACVDGGKKLIVILKGIDHVDLGNGDKFEQFITVSSSHDGTGAMVAMCTPIHNVSQTVFTPFSGKGVLKIKHAALAKRRLATARLVLGDMTSYWSDFSSAVKRLSQVTITDQEAKDYFAMLYPGDKTRVINTREKLFNIYHLHGMCVKLPSCRGTLFGAFMAVLQHADYYKLVKLKGPRASARTDIDIKLEARLTGSAAKDKLSAYGMALKLARL